MFLNMLKFVRRLQNLGALRKDSPLTMNDVISAIRSEVFLSDHDDIMNIQQLLSLAFRLKKAFLAVKSGRKRKVAEADWSTRKVHLVLRRNFHELSKSADNLEERNQCLVDECAKLKKEITSLKNSANARKRVPKCEGTSARTIARRKRTFLLFMKRATGQDYYVSKCDTPRRTSKKMERLGISQRSYRQVSCHSY